MQKQRVVPVLLGLVLGCALAVDAQTNISIGQTVNGNLTAASGRSVGCAACYADLYTFTLTSSQTLRVSMSSTAFDTYLRILNSAGQSVVEDDDGGGGTNSFIQHSFVAGTYRIEATSYEAGVGGAYSLSLQSATSTVMNISVGQTVNGNLSAGSGRSVACGDCFADLYQFTLTSSQTLDVTLSSSAFDTYLRILDSTGRLIPGFEDDDGGGGTNSFLQKTFAAGTYRIEATSYGSGESGPYTLTLAGANLQVRSITVGQTVTGNLTASAGRSSGCSACFADIYQFSVTSSQTLRILLTSTTFDAFLRVLDSNNQEVATDDDNGGGSNSLISRTFAPGTYKIEATTYGGGETGAYTLALTGVNISVTPITVGATPTTVNSSLSSSSGSSVGCAGCYANSYQFTLSSSQTVEINLSSTAYDTYLRVLDSGGATVAEDDDGGSGTNSRIRRILRAGTYRIEATSYDSGQTGAFTLTVQIVTVSVTSIGLGQSVNGNLTSASGRSSGCAGCYADLYQFTVTSSQQLVISMTSTAFDAYLRILDSGGNAVATDDDSGGGSNSRITRTFAAGTYRIEATSYDSGKTGAYTLSVASSASTSLPPALTSLSSTSAQAGSAAFTLIVNGSNFSNTTVVRWDGSNRTTTFVSTTQLQVAIPASDLSSARTVQITAATGSAVSNALNFTVTSSAPTLTVAPEFLQFSALENQTGIAAQNITVGGNVGWTAAARTSAGGGWLVISPASGSGPATARVTVNVAGLTAGAYTGLITFQGTSGGLLQVVAVTLVVSRAVPILQPSQSGFLFQGIEGQSIPPQTFQVLNVGSGTMNWTVRGQTSDGRNWLTVTPASGTTQAGSSSSAPTVTVRVDHSQLKAGVSVGILTLEATGAPNSPQAGFVLVNVMPAGSDPVIAVQPAGFVFTGTVNRTAPPARELTISASGGTALTYTASVASASGGNWLSVTPASGSLNAGRAALSVRANSSGLARGVYSGTVSVTLSTGVRQDLAVLLILSDAAVAAQATGPMAECVPTRLTLVETQLAGNFSISVSWPVSLRTLVVNDCGVPVTDATVIATFNTGDPPLTLQSLKDGNYTGNWIPSKPDRTVVTIRARAAGLTEAVGTVDGKVAATGAALPAVARNATLNAASFQRYAPVAPGSLVSVFGSNLGTSTAGAATLPLPMTLADVRAQLGGKDVPLVFANSGQVNAQVPTELTPGSTASLVVTVRGVAAAPDQITLSANQPGIFSINSSGTGQGAIQVANTSIFAAPSGSIPGAQARPVRRGEFITIYCTGLGATDPRVASGQPAVGAPRATIPVTVTIGGVNVPADFAGLSPGFVGLYQVNIQVPSSVTPGSAVQLFLTQGGVTSNTVTIAVD